MTSDDSVEPTAYTEMGNVARLLGRTGVMSATFVGDEKAMTEAMTVYKSVLKLTPGKSLRGRIVDAQGKPIATDIEEVQGKDVARSCEEVKDLRAAAAAKQKQ